MEINQFDEMRKELQAASDANSTALLNPELFAYACELFASGKGIYGVLSLTHLNKAIVAQWHRVFLSQVKKTRKVRPTDEPLKEGKYRIFRR